MCLWIKNKFLMIKQNIQSPCLNVLLFIAISTCFKVNIGQMVRVLASITKYLGSFPCDSYNISSRRSVPVVACFPYTWLVVGMRVRILLPPTYNPRNWIKRRADVMAKELNNALWLFKTVTWLATTNQSALIQHCLTALC